MRTTKSILLIYIFCFSLIKCKDGEKEIKTKIETEFATIETAGYEIVQVEDQSRKAIGGKPLSHYNKSEIENLPINKKILYRIVLAKDVKENQVKPTIEKIIDKLTTDDSDIDEIILWLYSDYDISNSTYDIGRAIWAPKGKLGDVNANIAETNNRNNYKIDYQIKKNLDQYLKQKFNTSARFGLTLEERKQVFKEIVKAEDNAFEYKKPKQDVVMRENKSKILRKYNITDSELREISNEGLDKYWPLD